VAAFLDVARVSELLPAPFGKMRAARQRQTADQNDRRRYKNSFQHSFSGAEVVRTSILVGAIDPNRQLRLEPTTKRSAGARRLFCGGKCGRDLSVPIRVATLRPLPHYFAASRERIKPLRILRERAFRGLFLMRLAGNRRIFVQTTKGDLRPDTVSARRRSIGDRDRRW
jgi:hypothetical protein